MSTFTKAANFSIARTVGTTYTAFDWGFGNTVALAVAADANHTVYTVSKVTLTNDDGAIDMKYVLDAKRDNTSAELDTISTAGQDHTLEAGETITHDIRCNTLWIEAASGTPEFRAWGEG